MLLIAIIAGFVFVGLVVFATVPAVRGQVFTWWGQALDLARRNGWRK